MKTKAFNISLPIELVEAIDAQADRELRSRSEYIRDAVRLRLNATRSRENAWQAMIEGGNKLGHDIGFKSDDEATDYIVKLVREVRTNHPL